MGYWPRNEDLFCYAVIFLLLCGICAAIVVMKTSCDLQSPIYHKSVVWALGIYMSYQIFVFDQVIVTKLNVVLIEMVAYL